MAGYFSKTDFTPSTSNTYTVSFWVKINNFAPTSSNVPYLWSISDSDTSGLFFQADTTPYNITFFRSNGSQRFSPTNYMRDVNAWWHIHLKVSSGTGTLYYNGESVKTSITVDAQNYNGGGAEHYIHTYGSGLTGYDNLECVMSHFHFVDGTAYEPTVFGSTDSTTGEWKINTSPSVTYGTNGYFILKDGNTGTDHSGNGNNFTLTGTCTKTEDCPSNVFCTMNPLDKHADLILGNGNTKTVSPSNAWHPCKATIGMLGQNGKFYWEGKCSSGTNHYFGVYDASGSVRGSVQSDMDSNRFVYTYAGGMERTITGQSAINSGTYATISNNDIVGVGLDKENGTITFWKNGTQIYTETHSSLQTKDLIPGTQAYGSDIFWNFGNGYFGTTQVSSAGTNASGNGIFEYDVPSGYTALSTKGLNL